MASAAQALAAVRQLKTMWERIAQMNPSDLAKTAGSGGGGDQKAFIKNLETWYNYLQKIAQLEKDITYQQTLRNKLSSDLIKNGAAYYQS
jgi:hypothetical protein